MFVTHAHYCYVQNIIFYCEATGEKKILDKTQADNKIGIPI